MTADLYKVLGVARTATEPVIRSAYRKKAIKAHPDMKGGCAQAFRKLKLAHDVLIHPGRRKHYDETGEIDDGQPEQGRTPVLQLVASVIMAVIESAISQGQDVKTMDLVRVASDVLAGKRKALDEQIKAATKGRELLESLNGRFTAKHAGEDNLIDPIIQASLAGIERQIVTLTAQKALCDEALKIVHSHSFRQDPKRPMQQWHFAPSATTTPSW